jgi:hypothetical protein
MGPNRRAQERERAAAARATERRDAVPATGVRGGRGGRDLLSGVGTLKSAPSIRPQPPSGQLYVGADHEPERALGVPGVS